MRGIRTSNNTLLDIVHCSRCNHILYLPVMFDKQFRNICFRCYTSTVGQYDKFARNFILESRIVQMKYPCIFTEYGCDCIVPYQSLGRHMKYCLYKRIPCPCYGYCFWYGPIKSLSNHFETNHRDNFIKSDKGLDFVIYLKLRTNLRINFLLVSFYGQFLLKICKEQNIIFYSLCFITKQRRCYFFKYKIEQLTYKEGYKVKTADYPVQIEPESKISYFDKKHALTIVLDPVLDKIATFEDVYMSLKIYDCYTK